VSSLSVGLLSVRTCFIGSVSLDLRCIIRSGSQSINKISGSPLRQRGKAKFLPSTAIALDVNYCNRRSNVLKRNGIWRKSRNDGLSSGSISCQSRYYTRTQRLGTWQVGAMRTNTRLKTCGRCVCVNYLKRIRQRGSDRIFPAKPPCGVSMPEKSRQPKIVKSMKISFLYT